jgi:hypothetical protein
MQPRGPHQQSINPQESNDEKSTSVDTVHGHTVLPKWPRLKVVKTEDGQVFTLDHPDSVAATAQLMKALGTDDTKFFVGLMKQLAYSGIDREINENELNFKVAFIIGQDQNLNSKRWFSLRWLTFTCQP